MRAIFYFDYSSPYAYLAASRIDELLPGAQWRPIAFGALIQEIGKRPWSFEEDRASHFSEIAERAQRRGLPEVVYPPGWPRESYSVLPLRAGLVAQEHGVLREYTRRAYEIAFAEGRALNELETVLEAARAAGLDPAGVAERVQSPEIKNRLRADTDAARDRGVTGVPTFEVAGELYWGDDRLEEAAMQEGTPLQEGV